MEIRLKIYWKRQKKKEEQLEILTNYEEYIAKLQASYESEKS